MDSEKEEETIEVYINTVSRLYERMNEQQRNDFKSQLSRWLLRSFEENIPQMVERFLSTPSIGPIPTIEKFVQLIYEAFQLYTNGLFYSTVALCGITAERLCYDIIEDSKISVNRQDLNLSQKKSLYRLSQAVLIDILFSWGLIEEKTREKLHEIRKIRNRYIHPSEFGKQEPEKDSFKMLSLVCQVIDIEYEPAPGARYAIEGGKLKKES